MRSGANPAVRFSSIDIGELDAHGIGVTPTATLRPNPNFCAAALGACTSLGRAPSSSQYLSAHSRT
jgi:hypothetical protein